MLKNWKKGSEVLMGIFTANPSITEQEKTDLAAAVAEDALALGAKVPTKKYEALSALAGLEVGAAELTEDAVGVSEAVLEALEVKFGELNASLETANTEKAAAVAGVTTVQASLDAITAEKASLEAEKATLTAEIAAFRAGIKQQGKGELDGDGKVTNPVAEAKLKAAADKQALIDKGWGDMVR
jgi:chromosome segregation ATPase